MEALVEIWLPPMVYAPNLANEAPMDGLKEMVLSKDPALHQRRMTALVGRLDASR